MAYIEWNDKFSVKVKEIDEQHKKLIGLINRLREGLFDMEVQKTVIDEIMDYVKYHFETEEKYMLKFQFYGFEEHKREHEDIAEKAVNIKNTFDMTGCLLSLAILDFLKDWFENHMLTVDQKYIECFNENGLE